MPEKTSISVIIVNYNAGPLLRRCLDSLLACPLSIEIIVVDNASHDGSLDGLLDSPHIRVIRNHTNVGFAAACNIGVLASSAPFLLFLNPDRFFQPDPIAPLLVGLQSGDRVGMVGGLLVNEDGAEQGADGGSALACLRMSLGTIPSATCLRAASAFSRASFRVVSRQIPRLSVLRFPPTL